MFGSLKKQYRDRLRPGFLYLVPSAVTSPKTIAQYPRKDVDIDSQGTEHLSPQRSLLLSFYSHTLSSDPGSHSSALHFLFWSFQVAYKGGHSVDPLGFGILHPAIQIHFERS